MVSINRIGDGGKEKNGWNMENVHDFTKWIRDNESKSNEGIEALNAVMSIGTDVASAACVKWFRERGWSQERVSALTDSICERIISSCKNGKESVVRDCATVFAGTGNIMMVMMLAFVSYSIIGVEVANGLIAENE